MNIALCFSGQLGGFKTSYPFLLENVIKPNNPDIFCYTSNAISQKDFYREPKFNFSPDGPICEYLRSGFGWRKNYDTYGIIYNIKESDIQSTLWSYLGESIKYLNIEQEIVSDCTSYDTDMQKWDWLKKRQLSKLKSCNTAVKKSEKDYDIVIRSRFDIAPKISIDISKILELQGGLSNNQNTIFVFGGWGPKGAPMTFMDEFFVDGFAFGTPRVMDVFCSLVDLEKPYPPNPKYVRTYDTWGDNVEHQFREHMLANNIDIKYISSNPKEYKINRT